MQQCATSCPEMRMHESSMTVLVNFHFAEDLLSSSREKVGPGTAWTCWSWAVPFSRPWFRCPTDMAILWSPGAYLSCHHEHPFIPWAHETHVLRQITLTLIYADTWMHLNMFEFCSALKVTSIQGLKGRQPRALPPTLVWRVCRICGSSESFASLGWCASRALRGSHDAWHLAGFEASFVAPPLPPTAFEQSNFWAALKKIAWRFRAIPWDSERA